MHASHRGARRLASAAGTVLAGLALAGPADAAQGGLELDWADCGEAGAQCATATVPKDYDNPRRGTLDIEVAKSPATNPDERIGSLFFNFGGPGAFAAPYVEVFGAELFPVLNERFDIVGVDPRGTGLADGLDCMVNQETDGVYSQPFATPENVNADALIRKDSRYIGRCIQRNDDLEYLSTANTARDLNAVREAVGDDKMTYLGFSYGTFLGATLQSLFPGKTRAVVLDGALDADQYINDPLDNLDEQTAGFERAISRFMTACAKHKDDLCPFGDGDVRGTIDDLIEQADASPIPASNAPDRPVDGDDIRASLVQEVYSIYAWNDLRDALVQLEAGDGAGIRTIADGFYGRNEDGSFSNGTDKYFLLSADEQNYPRRIDRYLRDGKSSWQDYDYAFWNHGYAELNWGLYPIRARDKYDGPFRTSRRDPTTLVVGTRYDPATPYKEAKKLVAQLGNARLLTMTGDGHTAYDGYPADGYNSECADKAIEAYLFDLALPAEGTKCAQDWPDFVTPEPAETVQTTAVTALRSSRAGSKLVIAPGTRPLRLP
jgi:pimeloyl-ACP methyl ester carboxylesterase